MQNVYSRQFCAVATTTTLTSVYTVPTGFVASLRGMTLGVSNPTRAATAAQVMMGPGGSWIWYVPLQASTTATFQWVGVLNMNAGDQLRVNTAGASTGWFTASGYLLALP